jgi:hypothetical protein
MSSRGYGRTSFALASRADPLGDRIGVAVADASREIATRPAHDTRERSRSARAVGRVVQGMRPPGEPDAAEIAERFGAETTVPEWRERLVCSRCGSRNVDKVVTGTERRCPNAS